MDTSLPLSSPEAPITSRRIRAWLSRGAIAGVALAVIVVGLPVAAPTVAAAATPAPKRIMSGWLPYWTMSTSSAAFVKNADLFSDISPFWHDARKSSSSSSGISISNNSLSSGSRSSWLKTLKGRGAYVMPSITDGSGAHTMAATMKNSTKRAALVSQIVNLVRSNGYDGIDLDFETFAFSDGSSSWSSTRPAWVAFVTALGKGLHQYGKKLSLAVPPMYNARRNGSSGYWVYDFAGVGPAIDKLRIMAYDYSWSTPGPIGGPLSWADSVAKFAVTQLPASKVQLGTPTYGRDWVTSKTGSGCPSLSQKVYDSRNRGSAISGVSGSSWKRDSASQERYINYSLTYNSGKCKVKRSAWLPDATTVAARAKTAGKYNLAGQATWTIGAEEASQWAPLRSYARALAPGSSPSLKSQSVGLRGAPTVARRGSKFTLSGAIAPARAGLAVRVQRYKGRWITKRKAITKNSGTYRAGVRPKAKKSRWRVVVPATGGYGRAVSPKITLRTR